MILLPLILSLFFILTSFCICRKSPIFFLAYSVLFAYTIFTQLGYILYPETIDIVSHNQYYGDEAFIAYWIYIFLSFIAIFLMFILLYGKKYKTILKLEINFLPSKLYNFLYVMIIFFYEIVLVSFLVKHYKNLSYSNQSILKNNRIWFYLFSSNGIILLSLFYKIYIENIRIKKIFYFFLFFSSLSIFSLTAIRSGQRIEILVTLLAFCGSLWYLFANKIRTIGLKSKYIFIIFVICFFIGISFLLGIRTIRGHIGGSPKELFTVLKNPKIYLSIFLPKNLIFQDWVIPSLGLMTSIEKDIIFPIEVIKSNLKVFIPFISHQSLGDILSRIIDPEGITGYGYYILTEGYNFMGFAGFIYASFIFVLGFRFLESFFTNTKDKIFNSFIFGIIASLTINVVRGQSTIFLKGLYLYFLPAIILFILMRGEKIYLVKSKIINKEIIK